MRIDFGLAIDGVPDITSTDGLGYARVGPQGMLGLLEGELGLTRPQSHQGKRILDYAAALSECQGRRFFSDSFEVDRLGVARQLLQWRDSWYLAGWNGHFDDAAPQRLRDMGDVEDLVKHHIDPCIGERLSIVAERLSQCRTQVESIQLLDPLAYFPARWRQVLSVLPVQSSPAAAVSPAPIFTATDLAAVQAGIQALVAGQKLAPLNWKNDESLMVVGDGPDVALTASLASRLGQLKDAGQRIAIIATEEAAMLDDALSGAGLPRSGVNTHSLAHPALQLLPLALQILWRPADAAAILDFLAHPLAPFGRGVARALSEVVAGTPGTGGEAWNKALTDALKNASEEYATRQRQAVEEWVQPDRYAPETGIPADVLRQRIDALAAAHRRALGQLDDSEQDRPADFANRQAALSHCLVLLDLLGTTANRDIKPRELARLLDFASESVATSHAIAEVGHPALLSDPSALIGDVDTLVWWRCIAQRLPEPYPWSADELEALDRAGADIPPLHMLLEQQSSGWLRAISQVKHRLIIVLPRAEKEMHPLVQMLGCLVNPLPVQSAAEFVEQSGLIPIESRPLPKIRRFWQLPATVTIPRRKRHDGSAGSESHSSLSLMLHTPHRWILRYIAKIDSGRLLALPETYTLYGLLLHKLAEWLFAEPNWLQWPESELDKWFDRNFPALIEEQGLVLLQSGRQSELSTLRYRGHRAMSSLVRHLKLAGVVRVRTEVAVNGTFRGGPLSGSADLVVENKAGQTAIVDLKWSNFGDKYGTLLREGRHLQLAMYSHLLREDDRAPTVAYFILNTARLLAQTRDYFPDADLASRANPEQDIPHLWRCLENHWQWRRDQLDAGLIEVVTEATEQLEESVPMRDYVLHSEKPSDRYDDTIHLVGWRAEA